MKNEAGTATDAGDSDELKKLREEAFADESAGKPEEQAEENMPEASGEEGQTDDEKTSRPDKEETDGDFGNNEKKEDESPDEDWREKYEKELKRRIDNQRAFTKARQEQKRMERTLEEQRLEELKLRRRLEQTGNAVPVDEGKEKREDGVLPEESISPAAPNDEVLAEELEKMVSQRVARELDRREKEQRESAWKNAVLKEESDAFDVMESPDFQGWTELNLDRVRSFLERYDRHDPRGVVGLVRMYREDSEPDAAVVPGKNSGEEAIREAGRHIKRNLSASKSRRAAPDKDDLRTALSDAFS